MAQIHAIINGKSITAEPGMTILQAARANGIHIPTLCDHPALSPFGACRVCSSDREEPQAVDILHHPHHRGHGGAHTNTPRVIEALQGGRRAAPRPASAGLFLLLQQREVRSSGRLRTSWASRTRASPTGRHERLAPAGGRQPSMSAIWTSASSADARPCLRRARSLPRHRLPGARHQHLHPAARWALRWRSRTASSADSASRSVLWGALCNLPSGGGRPWELKEGDVGLFLLRRGVRAGDQRQYEDGEDVSVCP